jgi:cytochrome P460
MKKTTLFGVAGMVALVLAVVGGTSSSGQEKDKQDRYALQIPGGLAFSEVKGYEQWQVVGPSFTEAAKVIRAILANPVMIKAYQEGIPGNGKPFPDGSKIVKIEWRPKKLTDPPFSANTPDTVPGDLAQVEFIVKDSKKFPDTHGWGYAMFDYDAASGTFAPATLASKPPVGHDAKCGAACHELAASKDYIFTAYPKR